MNALAAAVSAARFALLGERHDHPEHHEFQAWLLRRMLESGRRPAVAFEMLDTTQAPALAPPPRDLAARRAGLGDAVGWRASGWPEWRLYQPIAEIALAAGLPVVAANLPATAARARWRAATWRRSIRRSCGATRWTGRRRRRRRWRTRSAPCTVARCPTPSCRAWWWPSARATRTWPSASSPRSATAPC